VTYFLPAGKSPSLFNPFVAAPLGLRESPLAAPCYKHCN